MSRDHSDYLNEFIAGGDMTANEMIEMLADNVESSGQNLEDLDVYTQYLMSLDTLKSKDLITSEELELKVVHAQILKSNDPAGRSARTYLKVLNAMNLTTLHRRLDDVKKIDAMHDVFSNPRRKSIAYDIFSQAIATTIGEVIIASQGRCYIKDMTGYHSIGAFDARKFALFIFEAFNSITAEERYMTTSDTRKLANLIEDKVTETLDSGNHIIQFSDCYVANAEVFKGVSPIFPRYFIKRKVYKAVEKFYETKKFPEPNDETSTILELMMHLSSYDKQTFERFAADVSMVFCNHAGYRSKYSRMIKLYGKTGANGKSVFHSILSNTIGKSNITSFFAKDFTDSFRIGKITRSLIALEAEDSGKVNREAAQYIKAIVTADPLTVRDIRSNPEEVLPITTLFSNTNILTKSQDKTDGFARRIDWFEIKDKLIRKESWFKKLRSDATAQFLCEYLLVRMIDVVKNDHWPDISEAMQRTMDRFANENNSAIEYLKEFGLQAVIGHTKREVRNNYEKWCADNDLTVYYDTFDETLEVKYQLSTAKLTKATVNPESEAYAQIMQDARNHRLNGWLPAGVKYIDYTNLDEDGRLILDFLEKKSDLEADKRSNERATLESIKSFTPRYASEDLDDAKTLEESKSNSSKRSRSAEQDESSDSSQDLGSSDQSSNETEKISNSDEAVDS